MATASTAQTNEDLDCAASCNCRGGRDVREASTQTDAKLQGHGPRLSKVNLFTLLSLWMELFPKEEPEQRNGNQFTRGTGLVVVREHRVVGLHCSGPELHAGQIAVIRHGSRLASCELYFSRKPCASCLKMIINAGVSRISFWPGDPEISLLVGGCNRTDSNTQEAIFDASAAEKLKSNSGPHICVLLQPLAPGLQQFVEETSRRCDFMERVKRDDPGLDTGDLFRAHRRRDSDTFSREFLILPEQRHRDVLTQIGLENFCMEPYFSSLRQNMRELVELLASVTASVSPGQYGFYRKETSRKDPQPATLDLAQTQGVSQDIARHCIVQANLLAYRTEDHKVGVGAVIWAEGKSGRCDGTGRLYLVGCGYNAYPVGSEYAEYPQMDNKQQDRQRRKYRYIVHAEQNALTFRSAEIREEDNTMLFVTKCPCDECVPLIGGAEIKQIYTTDLDSGKDKGDISYLRFNSLQGVQKFIWQKSSSTVSVNSSPHLANGCTASMEDRRKRNFSAIRDYGQKGLVEQLKRHRD